MASAQKTWWVFGGMISTVDNAHFLGEVEAETESDAITAAWDLIVEEYETYAGLHGIPSWDDVRYELMPEYDNEELNDDIIQEAYNQEIESWTRLWVKEAVDGVDPEDLIEEV